MWANKNRTYLVALHEGGLVDETLVYVEGSHVVHDDGALEVLVLVLGLEDVLHHGGLARTQEPAQQRHGDKIFCACDMRLKTVLLKLLDG